MDWRNSMREGGRVGKERDLRYLSWGLVKNSFIHSIPLNHLIHSIQSFSLSDLVWFWYAARRNWNRIRFNSLLILISSWAGSVQHTMERVWGRVWGYERETFVAGSSNFLKKSYGREEKNGTESNGMWNGEWATERHYYLKCMNWICYNREHVLLN